MLFKTNDTTWMALVKQQPVVSFDVCLLLCLLMRVNMSHSFKMKTLSRSVSTVAPSKSSIKTTHFPWLLCLLWSSLYVFRFYSLFDGFFIFWPYFDPDLCWSFEIVTWEPNLCMWGWDCAFDGVIKLWFSAMSFFCWSSKWT